MLPIEIYEVLQKPSILLKNYSHLPCTFIHGDYRPNNIIYKSKPEIISLIDFAFSGYAPCTVDLFWYIATTTWLGTDYKETIELYRTHLESRIGLISDSLWSELIEVGIITACCMQLWEKALDYDSNPDDFNNWIKRFRNIL